MINIIRVITFIALLAGVCHSCKKENSCEGCINGNNPPVAVTNHPPIANAGNDATITFPYNTVNMDGSRSTDPDNNITSYRWTKIAGPSSSAITNVNAMQTQITNLAEGSYQIELKVTDAGGLLDWDTVKVIVDYSHTVKIFSNLTWSPDPDYDCTVRISNIYSYIPPGSNIEVWRTDTYNPGWHIVPHVSQTHSFNYYNILNGNLYYFEPMTDCGFDPTIFSFAIVIL
jgi:hypothetical protein